jgi:hypothetical protein
MQIAILFAVMIFGTIAFLLMRPGSTTSRIDRTRDRRSGFGVPEPFHAVSIRAAVQGCPAVESLGLQRFLSEEAPSLPLANCCAQGCACKYVHHADRRGGPRNRRLGVSEQSDVAESWSARDRRLVGGRRHKDRQAA